MFQIPCRSGFLRLNICHLKTVPSSQRWLHQKNEKSQTVPSLPSGSSKVKDVKEIQIPVPWGHISGKWWGRTDVQPILLLHGWQDNAGTFDTLVPLLDNESLLALEMVGHGQSSHYPLGQCYYYLDALVNLRRVVNHFGWKKISYIGHSMGSMMGFGYASLFSDGVDKFVSIDDVRGALVATLKPVAQELRRSVDANLLYEEKLKGSFPKYKYDEIVDLYCKGANGSVTREMAKIILKRGIVKSPDGDGFNFARDPRVKIFTWGNITAESINAMAGQIICEVLNIRASESFTSQPKPVELYEKSLDIMKKSAKKFEYHVVEGTHHVHLNNPECIAPLINKFLAPSVDNTVIY